MAWVLDSAGNLRISGSGSMADYAIDETAPWYDYRDQIREVRLGDGIADIGDYAFWQIPVSRIALPATVTEIGYYAFAETALEILVVPGTVEHIDVAAFSGCTDLVSVTLNTGIVTIGEGAFGGCTALTSLQIPASVSDLQPNICPGSGVVNIKDCEITNGKAEKGGNIFMQLDSSYSEVVMGVDTTLNIISGKITNGNAKVSGGNIYYMEGVQVNIADGVVSGGKAPTGADVHMQKKPTAAD